MSLLNVVDYISLFMIQVFVKKESRTTKERKLYLLVLNKQTHKAWRHILNNYHYDIRVTEKKCDTIPYIYA